MAVETATYIGELNETYPAGGEPVAQGDDHIRLLKATLKTTFAALGSGPYVPYVHPAETPLMAAGTRVLFAQAAAPSGWTQDVTDAADNRMLRVVKTAGAGVGGSHSPILNNVVPSHTHGFTTGNVSADHGHGVGDPGHDHGVRGGQPGLGGGTYVGDAQYGFYSRTSSSATGIWLGGISANHTHSGSTDNGSSQTNWTPRYADLIICSKD